MIESPNSPIKRPKRGSKARAIIKIAAENPTLTTREIGKLADSDHSNVVKVLQRYNIEHERVEKFKEHRADILAGIQEMLANSVSPEDIQKTNLRDRAVIFGILHDHERLERGKATQITQSIQYILSQIELEDKTGGKQPLKKAVEVGDVIDVTPHDDDSTEHE